MPVDTARLRKLLETRDLNRAAGALTLLAGSSAEAGKAFGVSQDAERILFAAIPALLDELEGLRARVAKLEERPVVEWRGFGDRPGNGAADVDDWRLTTSEHRWSPGLFAWHASRRALACEGVASSPEAAREAAERAAGLRGER